MLMLGAYLVLQSKQKNESKNGQVNVMGLSEDAYVSDLSFFFATVRIETTITEHAGQTAKQEKLINCYSSPIIYGTPPLKATTPI